MIQEIEISPDTDFKPCGQAGCKDGYLSSGHGVLFCKCRESYSKMHELTRYCGYANLPRNYYNARLSNFLILDDSEINKETYRKVYTFAEKLEENIKKGRSIILCGPNSCGKTHLAAALLKLALLKDFYAKYIMMISYINLVTSSWHNKTDSEVYDDIDAIKNTDLLVLDDLDKLSLNSTPFKGELVDELLRHRASDGHTTIITTNLYDDTSLAGYVGVSLDALIKRHYHILYFEGSYANELESNLAKELEYGQ